METGEDGKIILKKYALPASGYLHDVEVGCIADVPLKC
jgi:hypothetical protein